MASGALAAKVEILITPRHSAMSRPLYFVLFIPVQINGWVYATNVSHRGKTGQTIRNSSARLICISFRLCKYQSFICEWSVVSDSHFYVVSYGIVIIWAG